jgi:3-deoxy-7-phosphoheptulonate synthase
LISDPFLDGSGAINDGLFLARDLLLKILELSLPTGSEFLDPMTPRFLADAVTWGSIGARTSESPVHRQLASDLPMPVGFKNGMHGGLQVALDAITTAAHAHRLLTITALGRAAMVTSAGNPNCHVVLRGGQQPNYDAESVCGALEALRAVRLPARVVIDASHGNGGKDYRRQPWVIRNVARQVAAGQRGIRGVMIESFLEEGRQDPANPTSLTFGQSVTDACLGWETTALLLHELAAAANARRARQEVHDPRAAVASGDG